MSEIPCILLVDDDSGITEGLTLALESAGRTIVSCSDIAAAETALERFPVTHLVCDVQFSGEFGFEGLHFLDRVRALSPRCRIVLITGYAGESLRTAALARGAAAILTKPFAMSDLEEALGVGTWEGEAPADGSGVVRIPSLAEILRGDALVTAFQPIVRLTPNGPASFAFEALTRVRGRWLAGGPAMLFDYASRGDRLAEMNLAAMSRAIELAAPLPAGSMLFLNVDPVAFDKPLAAVLDRSARAAGLPLDRVVIEITERSAFSDTAAADRMFETLREAGVRFALDDHGSAYSHLPLIHRIRPSFIKISQTFGTALEDDATKERIVRHTVALASDFGCETILEGIECGATARAAEAAGVTLVQGFHFGKPHAASHWAAGRAALHAA
ncbi:MAG TPA: EAL domain-containing response regulator [Thermoanaerobaculia bacterium]|nr:EAL domain-containing response regulator [Thermoanaerobaculia bacterium]